MSPESGVKFTPHRARRQRLAKAVADRGLELAVVTTPESVAYYSGNEIAGGNTLLIHPDGTTIVICDAYDEYNFAAADPELRLEPYPYVSQLAAVLSRHLARTEGLVGIEMTGLSAKSWQVLTERKEMPALVSLDDVIADQRLVKDDAEIDLLRTAGDITKRAVTTACELLSAGPITEAELAAAVYSQMLREGSDHLASQPYIKSGPRALHTHARWTQRRIDASDHVLIELAACRRRYHAPIMRTRLADRHDHDYRATVEAVVAGRDAYLRALRPGVTTAALHAEHESVLTQHGMSHRNRHAGGYSLGVAFAPQWGETNLLMVGPSNSRPLQAGMALHLISGLTDPAADIPHIGLSECVLITETGHERLVAVPDFL
jgi:Xaa-Pro dipeptidase